MPKRNQPGHPCCCDDTLAAALAADLEVTVSGIADDGCSGTQCTDADGTYLLTYNTDYAGGVTFAGTWASCYSATDTIAGVIQCTDCGARLLSVTFSNGIYNSAQFMRRTTDSNLTSADLGRLAAGESLTLPLFSETDAVQGNCDWSAATMSVRLV